MKLGIFFRDGDDGLWHDLLGLGFREAGLDGRAIDAPPVGVEKFLLTVLIPSALQAGQQGLGKR